jgi:hypothetical protein
VAATTGGSSPSDTLMRGRRSITISCLRPATASDLEVVLLGRLRQVRGRELLLVRLVCGRSDLPGSLEHVTEP